MKISFQNLLHKINQDACPDLPEKQLVCAIMLRGVADYLYYLMYTQHSKKISYTYNEVRDCPKWLRNHRKPFSAYNCCTLIDIEWDQFRAYLDNIDSNSHDLAFLEKELLKYL